MIRREAMMHLYPERTANRNVPADVFLVAETEAMSGEIVTTYYIDCLLCLWSVADWVMCKPQSAKFSQLLVITGETKAQILSKWQAWRLA